MKSVRSKRRKEGDGSVGMALFVFACLPGVVLAQQPRSEEAVVNDAPVSQLEAISVTADNEGAVITRAVAMGALGRQKILDTPFSINSVTAPHLRDRQAGFLDEAFREDPSLSAPSSGYGLVRQFAVRGFTMGSSSNYRRNGLSFMHFAEAPFESIERIDLLKGLSGFAYGFTSPGGIIDFTPKKPTDQPWRAVTAGYTSHNMWRGHLDAGGRFGADDKLGYRVNIAYEQGETPVKRFDMRRSMVSAYLDWRVTPDLTLGLDVERSHIDPQDAPVYSYALAPGVSVPTAPKLSRFNGVGGVGYETTSTLVGVNADWAINSRWTASAKFLHHSFRRDGWFPLATINNAQGDMKVRMQRDALQAFPMRSAQVQLTGDLHLAGMRHELTAGVDWSNKKNYRGDYEFHATAYDSNLYDPAPAPATDIHSIRSKYKNADTREEGVFATDTIHVTEQVRVMIGLRHASIRARNFSFAGTQTPSYRTNATTPMVALIVKPAANMTLYGSWAEGLERGTTAPLTAANAGQTFGALKSKQAEVGLKWEATPDWAMTTAIFKIDKGLGFTDPVSKLYSQKGSQVNQGVELMLDGKLAQGLRLVTGMLWLDAKMKKTGNPLSEGQRPLNVPKRTFTALLEYEPPFVQGLGISAGYRYISDRAHDLGNREWVSGHGLLNAGLRWRTKIGGAPSTLRVNAENLTNKRYWGNVGSSLQPGVARTVKVSLETLF